MVSAQVPALGTKSKRGRDMGAGWLAGLERRGSGCRLAQLLWHSSGLSCTFYPSLPSSLSSSLFVPHGMGLAARSQHRGKGRKGTIFSILSPLGKDWPSNSRGRKIVGGFPLFCSLSAGALQRAVLRGGEDQRWKLWILCTWNGDRSLVTNAGWPSKARCAPEPPSN